MLTSNEFQRMLKKMRASVENETEDAEMFITEEQCDLVQAYLQCSPVSTRKIVGSFFTLLKRIFRKTVSWFTVPVMMRQTEVNRLFLREIIQLKEENETLRDEIERIGKMIDD